MIKSLYHLSFFIFIQIMVMASAEGQNARIPEKELETQSAFIDANRELILGNLDKAESLYRELQRKYPANHAVSYALAQLLMTREDYPNALSAIRTARKGQPDNTWYAILEADILEETGHYGDAAVLYMGLVTQYPKESYYYQQWAFYLMKAGDSKGAIQVFDQHEKELGFQEEIAQKKYMLYRGMGKMEEAAAVLEHVLANQPWNLGVMYTLADFYEENGGVELAKSWYNKILTNHPGESEAQLALVRLENSQSASGPLADLSLIFRDGQANLDDKIVAIIPHIQSFADQRDSVLGMALDSLANILDQTHPDQAKVASIKGDLAFYRGDYANAITAYQLALDRERTIFAIWDQLLLATSAANKFKEQVKFAEQALDVFPNQGRIHFFLAEGLLETGHPREGLEEISLARLMARKDGYLLYHLAILEGRSLARVGQMDAAFKAYATALSMNENGPEALAFRSLSQQDPNDRCKDAQSASQAANDLPIVTVALAACAFVQNDFIQATNLLEPLINSLDFPHPDWVELLGDSFSMSGKADLALTNWKRAKDLGSMSPSLSRKMTNLRYAE